MTLAEKVITLGSLSKNDLQDSVVVVQRPHYGEITSWVIKT
jgi:hypothetical protein